MPAPADRHPIWIRRTVTRPRTAARARTISPMASAPRATCSAGQGDAPETDPTVRCRSTTEDACGPRVGTAARMAIPPSISAHAPRTIQAAPTPGDAPVQVVDDDERHEQVRQRDEPPGDRHPRRGRRRRRAEGQGPEIVDGAGDPGDEGDEDEPGEGEPEPIEGRSWASKPATPEIVRGVFDDAVDGEDLDDPMSGAGDGRDGGQGEERDEDERPWPGRPIGTARSDPGSRLPEVGGRRRSGLRHERRDGQGRRRRGRRLRGGRRSRGGLRRLGRDRGHGLDHRRSPWSGFDHHGDAVDRGSVHRFLPRLHRSLGPPPTAHRSRTIHRPRARPARISSSAAVKRLEGDLGGRLGEGPRPEVRRQAAPESAAGRRSARGPSRCRAGRRRAG